MLRRSMVVAAALLIGVSGALAQSQPGRSRERSTQVQTSSKALMVGDRAPELTIDKWVKGEPITGFEKGKVYVVEFWATWCKPCVESIPHLTDLQNEYRSKGVTIVGVASGDARGNTLDAVQSMVEEQGSAMGYTVAWDADRWTNAAWMKAARQRSIPTAFIINEDGVVAFIGHPMKIDEPLKRIVARKYDLRSAIENHRKQIEKTEKAYVIQEKLDEFARHLQAGETDEAFRLGYELVDGPAKDDAEALNFIAWSLVDPAAELQSPDVGLALKAADRANDLTKNENPFVLDTLARVWFLRGNSNKSVSLQQRALDRAGADPQLRAELEKRLEEYKGAGKR